MFPGPFLNGILMLWERVMETCYSGIITAARQPIGSVSAEDSDGKEKKEFE